ncbi:ssl1498 family light-harvesting-like protein [Pleurocapsales cyanobacterium LEGE 06147]|nr:ssl1498 family light-harvesting-like protein [Pleurocapsales cyanobacterium LEGE 06147]
MNKQNIPSTITLKDKVVAHHISDGSELIPAEIQTNTSFDNSQLPNTPLSRGYTVDDEGIINNYATEPDMSLADYPSPEQQKRYIFLGAGAMLFVATVLLTAFAVS